MQSFEWINTNLVYILNFFVVYKYILIKQKYNMLFNKFKHIYMKKCNSVT
jgi:hypothetical protein